MKRNKEVRLNEKEAELVNELRMALFKRGTKVLPKPVTDEIQFDGSNGSTVGIAAKYILYMLQSFGGKD